MSLNRKGHFQGAIQGFLPLLLVVDRGSFFFFIFGQCFLKILKSEF